MFSLLLTCSVEDKQSQELVCPPEWLGLIPPGVEADHVIGDGEAEVEDRDDDGHLVPRDQQPHQPRLEHIGREEGEEHDDQGEHQTHVLDTEKEKVLLNFLSWALDLNWMHSLAQSRLTFYEISELL